MATVRNNQDRIDEFIRAANRLVADFEEMAEEAHANMYPSDAGKCARKLRRLIDDTFPEFSRAVMLLESEAQRL